MNLSKKIIHFLLLLLVLLVPSLLYISQPMNTDSVNFTKHPNLTGINLSKLYEKAVISYSNDMNCSDVSECEKFSEINAYEENYQYSHQN